MYRLRRLGRIIRIPSPTDDGDDDGVHGLKH